MNHKRAPVSAVIPAYNAEPFIAEAIESVLAQTLSVSEIVVVDDGSSDRTSEVAEGLGAKVIRQENRGLAAARNRCVLESTQPWIAFVDSDDVWEPEKMERQMSMAESDPAIALVTCDYCIFDDSGIITPSVLHKHLNAYESQIKTACDGGSVISEPDPRFNDIGNFLVPSMVLMRRAVLQETGLFDERFLVAEDFDCFMRMLLTRKLGFVEATLVRRRTHPRSASRRYAEAVLSCLAATRKVIENPSLYPAGTVEMCRESLPPNLRHAGARLIYSGQTKQARKLLIESARLAVSMRTFLALGAAMFPAKVASELMRARYFVSRKLGI